MTDVYKRQGLHWTNGFPDIFSGQLHTGMWLMTSHLAFCPHVPGQGSLHLLRIQALSLGQSVLSTHSGRHPEYGSPWYSGKHVQTPSRHWVFGPHGVGLQRSTGSGGLSIRRIFFIDNNDRTANIAKNNCYHSYPEVAEGSSLWMGHQYSQEDKYILECGWLHYIKLLTHMILDKGLYIFLVDMPCC